MGRVIRREVVALSCELRSCPAQVTLDPVPAPSTWHDEVDQLAALVNAAWGFVLTPQLRCYCPVHADRVWSCSCRTNPARAHLCTAHDSDAAGAVWDSLSTPQDVETYLALTKGAHA